MHKMIFILGDSMSVPYSKRKEYFKKYRETHRDKMSEYVKKHRIRKILRKKEKE